MSQISADPTRPAYATTPAFLGLVFEFAAREFERLGSDGRSTPSQEPTPRRDSGDACCIRCGRTLYAEASRRRRLGPDCYAIEKQDGGAAHA